MKVSSNEREDMCALWVIHALLERGDRRVSHRLSDGKLLMIRKGYWSYHGWGENTAESGGRRKGLKCSRLFRKYQPIYCIIAILEHDMYMMV